MDSKGECCVARFDDSKIDRIMHRFRPIAPKPVTPSGSVFGNSSPDKNEGFRRIKRKYVLRDGTNKRKGGRVSSEERKLLNDTITLSLLPEKPDVKDTSKVVHVSDPNMCILPKMWLDTNHQMQGVPSSDLKVLAPQPVGSCVEVECVTDTSTDVEELLLGSTDEEKKSCLEKDSCPGFISDGMSRVKWINEAYRNMVDKERVGGEARPEIVCLMMKVRVPGTYESFACKVRLQFTCRKERNTLTVPCDVWKMDGGGFAWRLDVKAALSLGR